MQESKRSMSAVGSKKRAKLDVFQYSLIPAGFDIELPPDLEPEIQVAIQQDGDIKYPKTLIFFKTIFPWIINWFAVYPPYMADTNTT